MATLTLYGVPQSTYTRTARMACEEKGIDYELVEVDPHSTEQKARHPFEKIPALAHGDFVLYETIAIGRYVDEAFEGPALQPADPKARAVMTRWMSAILDYMYDAMIRGLVLPRVVAPMQGRPADEDLIRKSLPVIDYHLTLLDAGLDGRDYLAGDAPTLADWLAEPIITYVRMTPDGGPIVDRNPNVAAWQDRMAARPSFDATAPSILKAES